MSVPVTLILEALGKAGIGDIVEKFIDKDNDADKLKLKVISTLVENMDDAGKCDIKTVIKALVEDD